MLIPFSDAYCLGYLLPGYWPQGPRSMCAWQYLQHPLKGTSKRRRLQFRQQDLRVNPPPHETSNEPIQPRRTKTSLSRKPRQTRHPFANGDGPKREQREMQPTTYCKFYSDPAEQSTTNSGSRKQQTAFPFQRPKEPVDPL